MTEVTFVTTDRSEFDILPASDFKTLRVAHAAHAAQAQPKRLYRHDYLFAPPIGGRFVLTPLVDLVRPVIRACLMLTRANKKRGIPIRCAGIAKET